MTSKIEQVKKLPSAQEMTKRINELEKRIETLESLRLKEFQAEMIPLINKMTQQIKDLQTLKGKIQFAPLP